MRRLYFSNKKITGMDLCWNNLFSSAKIQSIGSGDLLQLLHLQTRGQRLLQLLSLLLVGDLEGVEEARTADLELDIVGVLLYLYALGVLPPRLQEEILDLLDLTWHGGTSPIEVNQAILGL